MTSTVTPARRTSPAAGRPALSRCIGGTDPDDFAAEVWGTRPLLSTQAGAYDDLLDLAGVDELLSRRGLRTPFLRLARDGVVVPPARFTRSGGAGAEISDQIDPDAVLSLFADGATLVLQGVHRIWPPVQDFANRLAADLGHPVQANAYVTPPQSRGFSAHYDVHDVFVLQLAGRKRWTIHEPVHLLPLRDEPWEQRRDAVAARAAEPPYLESVLEPGDALYLPRGWLHAAQALGDVSAHLTLGVHALTRYAIVQALLAAATDDENLRTSLPLGLDPADADQVGAELAAVVAGLTRRLADASPDDIRDALADRVRAGSRPAPVAPLASAAAARGLTDTDVVRWRPLLPRPAAESSGGGVRIRLTGRALDLPADAEPLVDALASGEPVAVGDLPGASDDRLELVRRLLREGVVVPVAPTPAP